MGGADSACANEFFALTYYFVGFWDEYKHGGQNDAHEFLKKLLGVLCEDYLKQFSKPE